MTPPAPLVPEHVGQVGGLESTFKCMILFDLLSSFDPHFTNEETEALKG